MQKSILYRSFFILISVIVFSLNPPLSANEGLDKKISISIDTTVYEALNIIGDSIGYYFSYNAELFDAGEYVVASYENIAVSNLLDLIFKGHDFSYKVIGNQIVIGNKEEEVFKVILTGEKSNTINIKGVVKDAETAKPIPFATVGIPGKMKYTVCNSAGEFSLSIDKPEFDDTIQVSSMGYMSREISVSDYLQKEDGEFLMNTDYISIQEVVIRKINPLALIKKSIENIEVNYYNHPFMFAGFYRELIQKNRHYVSVTEAVVEGFKSSYTNKISSDQVRIIKGRKIVDDQRSDTVMLKLQAGLYTSMLLDIVKNPANFLNNEFFEDYNYYVTDLLLTDNKYIYVIGFDRKANSNFAFYKGEIYIDYSNAAILNVEFSLNRNGLKNASGFMIVKKPSGLKVAVESAKYTVNYTVEEDSLLRLNYIRNETAFKIKQKRKLFSNVYTIISEIAITSVDDSDVSRFSIREIAKRRDIFSEQVSTYDPDFWENYSIIPPEKPLLEAIDEFEPIIHHIKEEQGQ